MRSTTRIGLCHLLAVLMAIEPNILDRWLTFGPQSARAAQEQSALPKAGDDPSPADLKRLADEMGRSFKALETAARDIPRDTFDAKAIVDKVGKDPVKLFEWVRDNTYWVPYQGCLRGPTGVLMDRLGNSLDRSLLLADLLRDAGHQIRVVRGRLSEQQAKQFLAKLRPVPKEPIPRLPGLNKKETDVLLEKYAKDFGFDVTTVRNNVEKASLRSATLAEGAVQRVAEQTSMILKAIGRPGENTVKLQHELDLASKIAAIGDHWWVQRRETNAWVDLDPLLPVAQPGSAHATVTDTFAPDGKTGRIPLAGKFCHEVQVNIVIEQRTQDGSKEKTVLSHTLRPCELFGESITLRHLPMNWPRQMDLVKEKEPLKELNAIVLGEYEWLPVLVVGSKAFMQASFTDAGESDEAAPARLKSFLAAGELGKGIGNILGSGKIGKAATLGRPREKAKREAVLTAEWIDYVVNVPGQAPYTIRRQIFDVAGPAMRSTPGVTKLVISDNDRLVRGFALLGQTEMLVPVCNLSNEFVSTIAIRSVLDNRQAVLAMLDGARSQSVNEVFQLAAKLRPLAGRLYAVALARTAWSRFRGETYLDRPNILSRHLHIQHTGQSRVVLSEGFDIVANDVAVRHGATVDPYLVRLGQGVLDTNAEALLTKGPGVVENCAEMFAASTGQRVEWLTIRKADDLNRKELKLSKDIRARMKLDLAQGYIVMAPTTPIQMGERQVTSWWRIDPRTGQTLGIGERGWGQTAQEYQLMIALFVVWSVFAVLGFLGCTGDAPFRGTLTAGKAAVCSLCGFITGVLGTIGLVLLFLAPESIPLWVNPAMFGAGAGTLAFCTFGSVAPL